MSFLLLEGKIAKMKSETCHTFSTPTDTLVTSTHILLVKIKSRREAQSQWDLEICFSCWESMAKGVDKESCQRQGTDEKNTLSIFPLKLWNMLVEKF